MGEYGWLFLGFYLFSVAIACAIAHDFDVGSWREGIVVGSVGWLLIFGYPAWVVFG